MNFLRLQRRDGKTMQFLIKAKDQAEFETRLIDVERQGARLVQRGKHVDEGYTIYWALMKQDRDV